MQYNHLTFSWAIVQQGIFDFSFQIYVVSTTTFEDFKASISEEFWLTSNIRYPLEGYVVDEERPLIRDDRLPCCGIRLGWCLFLLVFFFGAIPWYIGAVILLCSQRRVDYREKPGYILCTIAGCCFCLLLALGWALAAYVRNREIKQMKNSMKGGNSLAFLSHEIEDLEHSKQVNLPRVTVVMPLKGFGEHNLHNWRSQITTLYDGVVDFLFKVESTEGL